MDTHLATLANTLSAINTRQAAARKRARIGANPTPFTTAVLNREKLDILTYIRDADRYLEQNLFWYPPLPQAQRQNQSSHSHPPQRRNDPSNFHQSTVDTQDPEQLLAPRLPEPRKIQPPTPLRQNAPPRSQRMAASSGQDSTHDAKTLLLAAQRLNDNYRGSSKARKQIKSLIKKHVDMKKSITQYEKAIHQNEAKLRTQSDDAPFHDSIMGNEFNDATGDDELVSMRQAIRTEELEILALEEMIAEMEQEKLKEQRSRQSLEFKIKAEARMQQKQEQRRQAKVQASSPELFAKDPIDDKQELQVEDQTPVQHPLPIESTEGDHTLLAPLPPPPIHDEPDSDSDSEHKANEQEDDSPTIKVSTSSSKLVDDEPQTQGDQQVEPEPQPSEELEQVTSKVWLVFGDGLRNVAADREVATFSETIPLLKLLIDGGDASDTSLGSIHTTSTQTSQLTESATASTTPFTPETMMTAFVILQMLYSAPPHSLNMETLKTMGNEWWTTQGHEAFIRTSRTSSSDSAEDGSNLARKAIYGMVSKQLFTVRRQKGVGTIEFA